MKIADALNVMDYGRLPGSYRVHFEWREGNTLSGDYFPDHSERSIPFETLARKYAKEFAKKLKGKVVNVYVVGSDFLPVDNKVYNRYPKQKEKK